MHASSVPQELIALAEERAAARANHDWAAADELKARVEAAGWRIVDSGTAFELTPARPADVVFADQTLYGAVDSVPSRLEEPALKPATIVVIAEPGGASPDAALSGLSTYRPDGTEVVVVAGRDVAVAGPADETIRTVEPLSAGDALQAALRRATGAVIVVLDPGQVPAGDIVSPLIDALDDPAVAMAGIEGLRSVDLHRYQPAGNGDVTTLRSGCYAFRRDDAVARGPIDGRLRLRGSVAAWWGLTLRDEGPDAPPRRAIVIDLPLTLQDDTPASGRDDARRARRDGYRIADGFRGRDWLAGDQPPEGRLVGDGTHGDHEHDDADEGGDTAPA